MRLNSNKVMRRKDSMFKAFNDFTYFGILI